MRMEWGALNRKNLSALPSMGGIRRFFFAHSPLMTANVEIFSRKMMFFRSFSSFEDESLSFNFKRRIYLESWPFLKREMVDFFAAQESRRGGFDSSKSSLKAKLWPKYVTKQKLLNDGYVPAILYGHGEEQKIAIRREAIHEYAFDEAEGHLSLRFKGRLYSIEVEQLQVDCVVSGVDVDPVRKCVYFIRFARHVKGEITEVEIPCTMIGLLACPAYLKGFQVELAMPTINCQIVGDYFPPPFHIDVSKLDYIAPYSSITLKDLQPLLPNDGTVRFNPTRYAKLDEQEVVWSYQAGTIQEEPLPADYVDPNFLNKKGKRIQLTYKGFWPKQ